VKKQSHADSDREKREAKATQIVAVLLKRVPDLTSAALLEIGTGSGLIASSLAPMVRSLLSVDVVDERVTHDFAFQVVDSELLPCTNASIDVVISNHVIEHVDDQLRHLNEIRRVLRPGGVCYLATPNRFAIMEPHFRLPFLSWLPTGLRSAYVRLARRGSGYDVNPLDYARLARLAAAADLALDNRSLYVAQQALSSKGLRLPMLRRMEPLFPSFVVLLQPA
jgi:SAM-dependent methyltransferase